MFWIIYIIQYLHRIKELPCGPPAQSFPSNSKDLSVKALAARRHSRFAPAILLLLALVTVGVVYALAAPRTADRKSTRLNSSHVAISYAVFCLKKKKERQVMAKQPISIEKSR